MAQHGPPAERPATSRLSLLPLCFLVLGAWGLVSSCGPSVEQAARASARDDAAAALELGDPGQALALARRGLSTGGDDAELLLLAGTAELQLKRYSEAVDLAERALPLAEAVALKANLRWLQGKALMGRFNDLHQADDWRRANVTLEPAVAAGSHRADAALMLVLLQDMSAQGRPERQLRYARELLALAPDSPELAKVRAYLQQRGVDL